MIFPIRAAFCVPAIVYLDFTEDTLLRFARGAEFILMVARMDIRRNYALPPRTPLAARERLALVRHEKYRE